MSIVLKFAEQLPPMVREELQQLVASLQAVLRTRLILGSGQVPFPVTQVASSNANTLDDYEEGDWTPADGSGAGLVFTTAAGQYVKIGQLVHVAVNVIYPVTANGANARISGLPFPNGTFQHGLTFGYTDAALEFSPLLPGSATVIDFYTHAGVILINSQLSARTLRFSGTYRAAT